jgi:hypothetical protein
LGDRETADAEGTVWDIDGWRLVHAQDAVDVELAKKASPQRKPGVWGLVRGDFATKHRERPWERSLCAGRYESVAKGSLRVTYVTDPRRHLESQTRRELGESKSF